MSGVFMDNVLTEQQRKDSWFWLVVGGAFAIGLALFVYNVDRYLSTSNSEAVLAETLREIRSAQASLPSSVDDRQLGGLSAEKRAE